MARIDLKSTSGFPIVYDGEGLIIKDFSIKERFDVTIDDIREQLLNKELTCPDIFYTKYKNLDDNNLYKDKGFKVNIYTMRPNLAGIEYVKTRATRCKSYPRIFDVAHGGATFLLQNYNNAKNNQIYTATLKKKDKIIVPPNYSVVVVNARQNSNLVFVEYSSIKAKPRVVLDDRNGLAYYIIRKNAKQEVVRNPSYKIVNDIKKLDRERMIDNQGITPKTPVIKQILRKYERFDWLFKENSIEL